MNKTREKERDRINVIEIKSKNYKTKQKRIFIYHVDYFQYDVI